MNVTDVCWFPSSTEVLSSSYDQTVKVWDIESVKVLENYDCDGLVSCIDIKKIGTLAYLKGINMCRPSVIRICNE
jgi:WD40 repeat protein